MQNKIRLAIHYLQQAIRNNEYEGTQEQALKILDELVKLMSKK